MQTGKKAAESVKETTSNVAASAKSGMDKTKAVMQEKVDKMRANDDFEKAMATDKKVDRMTEAELLKQQAMSHNAAEKDAKIASVESKPTTGAKSATTAATITTTTGPQYSYSASTEAQGRPTGAHQMSAMPGHGTGEPAGGHVVSGTETEAHPRSTKADNRHVGGRTGTGYVD